MLSPPVLRDSPQRLTLLESTVRGVSFAGGRGEAQHPSTGDNSISVRWVEHYRWKLGLVVSLLSLRLALSSRTCMVYFVYGVCDDVRWCLVLSSKWVVRGICGYMVHVHLLHSYCMTNGLAWIGNLWLVSVVVGSLLIRILGPGSRYDNFSCRILFQLAVLWFLLDVICSRMHLLWE